MARFICWQTNTGHDCNNVFANGILLTLVTGLWNPLVSRDRQFEKPYY